MNKGDLQNRLAKNCNLTAKQAAQALNVNGPLKVYQKWP